MGQSPLVIEFISMKLCKTVQISNAPGLFPMLSLTRFQESKSRELIEDESEKGKKIRGWFLLIKHWWTLFDKHSIFFTLALWLSLLLGLDYLYRWIEHRKQEMKEERSVKFGEKTLCMWISSKPMHFCLQRLFQSSVFLFRLISITSLLDNQSLLSLPISVCSVQKQHGSACWNYERVQIDTALHKHICIAHELSLFCRPFQVCLFAINKWLDLVLSVELCSTN